MNNEPILIKSLDIIILGSFNPSIFQPYWFSLKGLIREEESENAKINIIHSSFVQFNLDWCSFSITDSKFQISTTDEVNFDLLKDLVVSTFNILRETPLTALGVNYTYNFSLENEKNYIKFGEWLSNLSFWQEIDNNYKLITLETTKPKKENGELGSQRIRITPSNLPRLKFGVSINFNEHIQFKNNPEVLSSKNDLISLFENKWKSYSIDTKQIVLKIWETFKTIQK